MQNNRLRYVHDNINSAYTEDIDNQTPLTLAQVQTEKLPEQAGDNYGYDAIGNLIRDTKEKIDAITWNVYGKINSISKTDGTNISYSYNAAGNRISKNVNGKETWYVRDASGNVMSVYTVDPAVNNGRLTQSEIDLYGSSRLGILNQSRDVSALTKVNYSNLKTTFEMKNKFFELSDHRGNVMAVVSNKKTGHSTNGITIDNYSADVISAQDYYPGGMWMPGRKYSIANTNYRYGFNGKELDKETSSTTTYDYGFRIYSPALGRFPSVDPLTKKYPELAPYQFAENSPILFIDLDGLEKALPWYLRANKYGGKPVFISKLSDQELINSAINPKDYKKITLNTGTGTVLDGNTRIYELQKRGLGNIEVPYQEYIPDNSMFPQLKEPPKKR